MEKHKIVTKRSLKYADMVVSECSCGWYESRHTGNYQTRTLRECRQELAYLRADHLAEVKEAK